MKISYRAASWLALVLFWLILTAFSFIIIMGLRDRARLIRDRDIEQLFSALFASLREYESFDAAIADIPLLRERVAGFAVYGQNLEALWHWGGAPERLDEAPLLNRPPSRTGRYMITDMRASSIKFVIQLGRVTPSPPRQPRRAGQGAERNMRHGDHQAASRMISPNMALPNMASPNMASPNMAMPEPPAPETLFRQRSEPEGFFAVLMRGRYCYIEARDPAYWRTIISTTIAFPLTGIALFALLFYVRSLFVRNREYQEHIEEQKNLVVLGSAASTLAHEIKNPLLAIRIQTGILEKLAGGGEEVRIINEEVDRLSALTYRINDYIRDAKGRPEAVMVSRILSETAERMLPGRQFVLDRTGGDARVCFDPERLRSVFENLIRNALESGGKAEDCGAEIMRHGGTITVTVFDRGQGIAPGLLERVFDPFFTGKSSGTGIGLSICRRFVNAAGGSVRLENREGGGAAAHVTLPEYSTAG
ncbi:MAG: HAMP domain-containing histidine kinase [Spirochaetaceae bacterium]|nr:HAMP domain-containing histidine kinase [Spirochaetaceae bacterium]